MNTSWEHSNIQLQDNMFTLNKNDYRFIKTVQDKYLGQLDMYIHQQTQTTIFGHEIILLDPEEVKKLREYLELIKNIKHQNIVTIIDYGVESKMKFCGKRFVFNVYIPFYFDNLVSKNSQEKEPIKDKNQLLNIFYSITEAIRYLEYFEVHIDDLSPYMIQLRDNNYCLNMLQYLQPYTIDRAKSKQLLRIHYDEELYCSPECFQSLSNKDLNFYFNQDKENSFALGLILIEKGLQKSIKKLYSKESKEIWQDFLKDLIDEFVDIFISQSKLLVQIVTQLCYYQQYWRLTFKQVLFKIPSYQKIKENQQQGVWQSIWSDEFNSNLQKSTARNALQPFFSPFLNESQFKTQNTQENKHQTIYYDSHKKINQSFDRPSTQLLSKQNIQNLQQNPLKTNVRAQPEIIEIKKVTLPMQRQPPIQRAQNNNQIKRIKLEQQQNKQNQVQTQRENLFINSYASLLVQNHKSTVNEVIKRTTQKMNMPIKIQQQPQFHTYREN